VNPFNYVRATDVDEALAQFRPGSRFIAGGTNLLDLMKENVARPERLIDITRLPLGDITELEDGRVRVGALVSNADLAHDPLIEARYPLLSQAILAGASPQLRNMATTGGNPVAANPLLLLLRRGHALQQARAWHRLPSAYRP
jgi:xanthine dehydrogenase YagS FAD-binding subunit